MVAQLYTSFTRIPQLPKSPKRIRHSVFKVNLKEEK